MLPRSVDVTLAPADPSVIFGSDDGVGGREGVMNGANALNVTIDCTGDALSTVPQATTGIVTVTIWYRATRGSTLVPDATTVAIPIAGKRLIGLTPPNTNVYEVVLTASVAAPAAGTEQVVVSSETQRVT
jgi:hypothetical protein